MFPPAVTPNLFPPSYLPPLLRPAPHPSPLPKSPFSIINQITAAKLSFSSSSSPSSSATCLVGKMYVLLVLFIFRKHFSHFEVGLLHSFLFSFFSTSLTCILQPGGIDGLETGNKEKKNKNKGIMKIIKSDTEAEEGLSFRKCGIRLMISFFSIKIKEHSAS